MSISQSRNNASLRVCSQYPRKGILIRGKYHTQTHTKKKLVHLKVLGRSSNQACGQSAVRVPSSESGKQEEWTEQSRQHDGDGRGSHTDCSTVLIFFTCKAKQIIVTPRSVKQSMGNQLKERPSATKNGSIQHKRVACHSKSVESWILMSRQPYRVTSGRIVLSKSPLLSFKKKVTN